MSTPPAPSNDRALLSPSHQSRWWVIALGVLVSLSCIGAIIGVPLIITEINAARGKRKPIPTAYILIGCAVLMVIGIIADKTEKPTSVLAPPTTSTSKATPPVPSKVNTPKDQVSQTKLQNDSTDTQQPVPPRPARTEKPITSSPLQTEAVHRVDLGVSVSEVVAAFAERGFSISNHPGTQRSDGWVGSTENGSLSVSLQGDEPNGAPDRLTSAIITMNIRIQDDDTLPYPKKQYLALLYQMVLPEISSDRLPAWSNEIATALAHTQRPVVRFVNGKTVTAKVTAGTVFQVTITQK